MPDSIRLKHPTPDITIEADTIMGAHLGSRIPEMLIAATYRADLVWSTMFLMLWPSRPGVKFTFRRVFTIFIENLTPIIALSAIKT